MENKKIYASEANSHWYDKDGVPCHEVPKASGKGKTKTTLTQARKLGLFPSVTTIFKILDNEKREYER